MANNSPKDCVVLVPVAGHIEPGCDAALQVLEKRGYQVRRVRGYSQIDVGRNQLATDALRDGFAELLWVDSDVVFHPDDVERLRSHDLPFVCGIYAKKNRREFACSFLPGTETLAFGAGGGLAEILYVGFGFAHTRRNLYETIQRQCELPECNRKFGSALVPYFMPFAIPHRDDFWYLGEDYAFCERARQCGFKVMLDTRIRLWHVGTYTFGWEDAGSDKERFAEYTFHLTPRNSKSQADTAEAGPRESSISPIQKLTLRHPWPLQRPDLTVAEDDGWLYPATRDVLRASITPQTRVILELGTWTGLSTRYMADCAPQAVVITVDHWKGNREHAADLKVSFRLRRLYQEFLAACWSYRDRIIPLSSTTDAGMREVHACGIAPDLIYVDADHAYESVLADVALASRLFPAAPIVGDDWDWDSVRNAVTDSSVQQNRALTVTGNAWSLRPTTAKTIKRSGATKRFCLFTTGRAGSTSLMDALAQFDDIGVPNKQVDCVDHEILHPDHIARYIQQYQRLSGLIVRDELSLIEAFFESNRHFPYAGFKTMPDRHLDLGVLAAQDDMLLMTLTRRDIASTIASYLVAWENGTWRRNGGIQQNRLTFGPAFEEAALAHLDYIENNERLLQAFPKAVHLDYEDLCSDQFHSQPLDDFFQRHIQLIAPKPPTSAATYVTNWDDFCAFIENHRQLNSN